LVGDPKATRIVEELSNLANVDRIACERITGIVRTLKTFARPDPAEPQEVDLNENIRDTLKLTHGEFGHRIQVETDFGDIPKVRCYPQKLNQVFLNLLVNAGQAIEGEGKVTVRTRTEADQIHISISDTGRGITPENQKKLFSTGFTTKPLGEGTGLGLSISRNIVQQHGGTIDVESPPGQGATFHIRIPLNIGHAAASPEEKA
jgi:two-component system NtrC family sensor kinase